MKLVFHTVGLLVAAAMLCAQPKETKVTAFTIEQDVVLAGSPEEVYDAVTGDISPWWDHHFTPTPKKFYIEARPGGGFYEIFNDTGDGVLHGTVIWAERGKRLRFSGPLVLSGRYADFVTTYDLKADTAGTRLHLTVNFGGQCPEGFEKTVAEVWNHFLVERLKPYMEKRHTGAKTDGPRVKNTSYVTPSGERVLRHEILVNANLAEVWNALTTSAGLMSFMAAAVRVELKTGGRFDSNYRVGGKPDDQDAIHNQVLNYIPMEMFSIKVGLTKQFPARPREAGTLFAVLNLRDAGNKQVLVTESMLGWGAGEDWNQVYNFFDRGNAYTLAELAKRFDQGPVTWEQKKGE
ncbi:MAG TPA: SRPBCC domain-containing protein [Bryobacteraceae bacterium]|nr:SRPBCC domain-containing protein [Bryobacteraceae bacterium]